VDVEIRDIAAPEEDLFADLPPEVLPDPDPEVLYEPGPEVQPDRVPVPPLSLQRVLDRAKPSLAEAASLCAIVLEAIADMHDAGCTHGSLDSRSVRLTADCEVRLTDRPHCADDADADERRADIRAVAAIVAEIDKATGRPARPLTEREERIADRLASAADPRSLSRRGLRRASRGLELAIGPTGRRDAARQGVAGLVRVVSGHDRPPNRIGSSGASSSGRGRAAPLGRRLPPPARRPPLWPRIWKPVAIAAVVLLLLGMEVTFFGDSVTRNVKTLLSGKAQAASGPRQPAPLPDFGPPAAGPVTHLELRPLDGCRSEATCNTVVQVAVQPQAKPLDVAWNFELVDRCGTLRESRPGGVLSVPAGQDRAIQTVAVALPAGGALTLVPVTTSPARVAGTPLPLFPADRPC
jgi:hypothetical protein